MRKQRLKKKKSYSGIFPTNSRAMNLGGVSFVSDASFSACAWRLEGKAYDCVAIVKQNKKTYAQGLPRHQPAAQALQASSTLLFKWGAVHLYVMRQHFRSLEGNSPIGCIGPINLHRVYQPRIPSISHTSLWHIKETQTENCRWRDLFETTHGTVAWDMNCGPHANVANQSWWRCDR